MRKQVAPRLLPMALVALAFLSCGSSSEFPFATYGPEWNGDDARLEGELVRDGPCLYVVDPPGFVTDGGRVLLAFGPGATWDEDGEAVGYFGREIRVGERIRVGGSIASAAVREESWIRKPDASCDTRSLWLVSQP